GAAISSALEYILPTLNRSICYGDHGITGSPPMLENDGTDKIDVVLSHLGRGHDLQDFPGTATEKLGFIRTAGARKLIAWNRARGRYELALAGWRRIARGRKLGFAPLVMGATIGAAIGAGALAVLWGAADVSSGSVGRRAIVPVSHPVEANVGLGMSVPPQPTSVVPAAPPAKNDPSPPQVGAPAQRVTVAEPAAAEEPTSQATGTVAKQSAGRKHRHRKMSRAHTRRMWASAYRDERYPRIGRIFR